MMIELTLQRVKDLAKQVVGEKSDDFVYVDRGGIKADRYGSANCSYVHVHKDFDDLTGAVPGCLVGQILHRAGVTIEQLSLGDSYLNGGCSHSADELLEDLKRADRISYQGSVATFLRDLQDAQDKGKTWHAALKITLEGY
jgi:hypothetical protein